VPSQTTRGFGTLFFFKTALRHLFVPTGQFDFIFLNKRKIKSKIKPDVSTKAGRRVPAFRPKKIRQKSGKQVVQKKKRRKTSSSFFVGLRFAKTQNQLLLFEYPKNERCGLLLRA